MVFFFPLVLFFYLSSGLLFFLPSAVSVNLALEHSLALSGWFTLPPLDNSKSRFLRVTWKLLLDRVAFFQNRNIPLVEMSESIRKASSVCPCCCSELLVPTDQAAVILEKTHKRVNQSHSKTFAALGYCSLSPIDPEDKRKITFIKCLLCA